MVSRGAIGNVRFWHKADISRPSPDVRFFGGKADIEWMRCNVRFRPQRDIVRRSRNCAHDLAPPANVKVLVQKLRFLETHRNALDVFLASKGLPPDVFGECVVGVDLFELFPNPARVLELAEM